MPQPKPFRTRKLRLHAESLETRELLTGGAGSTFAITAGNITSAGGSQATTVHIDSSHFTMPRHSVTIGIDLAPVGNSAISGRIDSISQNAEGGQRGSRIRLQRVRNNEAILANLRLPRGQTGADETINVTAQNGTQGQYLLGFYLAGDANGDGQVDKTDISLIDKAIGAISGDKQYTLDLDTNRDGRIGLNDMMLAKRNLGVKTTITPVLNANLDPASDTGTSDRITNEKVVHFSGLGTPGATITYAEVNNRTPAVSTTADASGNYSLNIPLALGTNTFQLTSTDAFKQTISGTISPVTYMTEAVPGSEKT
jgi:hypothetical protein